MDEVPRGDEEPAMPWEGADPATTECCDDWPEVPANEERTPEEAGYGYGV
jgi:hypothetical protein